MHLSDTPREGQKVWDTAPERLGGATRDARVRAARARGRRAHPVRRARPRVGPRGALPFARHHDAGSLVTLDVMLADPRAGEFEGGAFQTLEADGALRSYPEFARGDALDEFYEG